MLPPIPQYFSNDILFDVFLALNRNESEKCQLVNRAWNTLLSSRCPILPLRSFFAIFYYGPHWRMRFYGFEYKVSEDTRTNCYEFTVNLIPHVKSLKYCVFDQILQFQANDDFVTNLAQLAEVCGQKIKTKIFRTNVENSALYRVILEKYIDAEKIGILSTTYEDLKPGLMNGCMLRNQTFPWPVCIECYDFPSGNDDMNALVEFASRAGEMYENLKLISFGQLNYFGFKKLYEVRKVERKDAN